MGAPSQADGVDLHETSLDPSKVADNNTDNAVSGSMEETYTSLIQQYLSVLCIDNATFLAERFVAHCKTNHSLYLLAICHHRAGKPQSARLVLEQAKTPTAPMQYLLAKCFYDMKQYGSAEDVLLQTCRANYRLARQQDGTLVCDEYTMEEWILSETPCPIPNGAAGLHLLGLICRHSNRNKRAILYFSMSLQLDPMLWTSYQALCELGAAEDDDAKGDINTDPTHVFGVCPTALILNTQEEQQAREQQSTTDAAAAAAAAQPRGVLTPSFSLSQTPRESPGLRTPGSMMRQLEIGTPSSVYRPNQNFSLFPTSTGTATRTAPRTGLHRASLFETPNLTPIPVQEDHHHLQNKSLFAAGEQEGIASSTAITSPAPPPTHLHVLHRASKVASRLYYEPSPEMTPSRQESRARVLFLEGLDSGRSGRPSLASSERINDGMAVDGTIARNGAIHDDNGEVVDDNDQDMTTTTTSPPPPTLTGTRTRRKPPAPEPFRTPSLGPFATTTEMRTDQAEATSSQEDAASIGAKGKDDGGVANEECVESILELLCTLGASYKRQCQYRCREALQILHQLPQEQFHTGWVLHQVGQCYFEMGDYQNAQRHLDMMQQLEPYRMKGLELLSTILWHLKKEVELAHLAQRAVDFDRLCPESWCVVGNCFALQKEHETALTFFRRSIQLDPSFTYSHTLSGHEYVAVEDFEKAVACYRDAICADIRHYNAWYGLGAIYYRQEKYDLAEYHFRRAISINPQSSVLYCHLGMAQHANGKAYEALETLAEAFRIDSRNPQARYQRATIYMAMERPHEALAELEKVRDAAPREPSVHFAMGRVLKRIGRTEQAMRCFLTALDLDPKDSNLIKAAMDKMDEPDIGDEEVSPY